ncbi:MAG: hypothetical protein ACLTAV_06030 [Finegoldia magna]
MRSFLQPDFRVMQAIFKKCYFQMEEEFTGQRKLWCDEYTDLRLIMNNETKRIGEGRREGVLRKTRIN